MVVAPGLGCTVPTSGGQADSRPTLSVFVASHCSGCEAALRLARRVRARAPGWRVEIICIDAEGARVPDSIIGTPMYTWNGRALYFGNPAEDELLALLAQLQPNDT